MSAPEVYPGHLPSWTGPEMYSMLRWCTLPFKQLWMLASNTFSMCERLKTQTAELFPVLVEEPLADPKLPTRNESVDGCLPLPWMLLRTWLFSVKKASLARLYCLPLEAVNTPRSGH